MEQRPLRLGDIVDDYCPRERRITNHVIAALMGDAIKQTRCSTCDTEHVYKGGRVPSRRSKKNDVAALETAVLASVNGTQLVARIDPAQSTTRQAEGADDAAEAVIEVRSADSTSTTGPDSAADGDGANEQGDAAEPLPGGWVGHRTLIRATLPRTDNDPPPPRPIPEFTMHQRQPRGGHGFRGGQGWGDRGRGGPRGNFAFGNGHPHERNGNANGNGNSDNFGNTFSGSNGSHQRNGGPPHGPGNGQGQGQGRPNGHRRHRHGKHRRPR